MSPIHGQETKSIFQFSAVNFESYFRLPPDNTLATFLVSTFGISQFQAFGISQFLDNPEDLTKIYGWGGGQAET